MMERDSLRFVLIRGFLSQKLLTLFLRLSLEKNREADKYCRKHDIDRKLRNTADRQHQDAAYNPADGT